MFIAVLFWSAIINTFSHELLPLPLTKMYSEPTKSDPTIWSTPKSWPPAPWTPAENDPTPEPELTTIGFVDSINVPMTP